MNNFKCSGTTNLSDFVRIFYYYKWTLLKFKILHVWVYQQDHEPFTIKEWRPDWQVITISLCFLGVQKEDPSARKQERGRGWGHSWGVKSALWQEELGLLWHITSRFTRMMHVYTPAVWTLPLWILPYATRPHLCQSASPPVTHANDRNYVMQPAERNYFFFF